MGSGASIAEVLNATTPEDVRAAVISLSAEKQQKLREALQGATPASASNPKCALMEEPADIVKCVLCAKMLRLLSARWLLEQSDAFVLKRCQDMPTEAFLEGELAGKLSDEEGGIIAVSYPWLTRQHPDPVGYHMKRVTRYVKLHFQYYVNEMGSCIDVGIFWDFVSLPQNHPDGKMRTNEEHQTFQAGLKAINLIYGGKITHVIQLTRMPSEISAPSTFDQNSCPYVERGWCHFEATVSAIIKDGDLLLDLGLAEDILFDGASNLTDLQQAATGQRQPPPTPEDFAITLSARKFTNGADLGFVVQKYRNFFFQQVVASSAFFFGNWSSRKGWGNTELTQLSRALPFFEACEKLWIQGHTFGDEGLKALAEVLPAMPCLKVLGLSGGGWTDDNTTYEAVGLNALSAHLPACRSLTLLVLPGRLESHKDLLPLRSACEKQGVELSFP